MRARIRQRALIATHTVAGLRQRWDAGARIAAVGAGTGDGAAQLAASSGATSLTLVDRDPMALGRRIRRDGRTCAGLARDGVAGAARRGRRARQVLARSTSSTSRARSTRCPTARRSSCCARRGRRCAPVASSSRRPCSTAARSRRCSIASLRWPAVIQRSAGELAALIAAAGFAERQISLAIPATAPVYAIATIDTAA